MMTQVEIKETIELVKGLVEYVDRLQNDRDMLHQALSVLVKILLEQRRLTHEEVVELQTMQTALSELHSVDKEVN